MRTSKDHWPLVFAIATLWLAAVAVWLVSLKQNEGHFVYALDDPYIHMAMAKNFARAGVWGVTGYEFSSSTSSLFWTLLLSGCDLLTGVHEATPFILNLIFASLLLFAAYLVLKRYSIHGPKSFLLLMALLFLTPLLPLIFTGMEHTAQILLNLAFVYLAARVLSQESFALSEDWAVCPLALAPLVTLIRYEGLFLVFITCALFVLRGRLLYSLLLGSLALIPLVIYGLISQRHGAFWLPNSVLLKGTSPAQGYTVLLKHAILQIAIAPHLAMLFLLALGCYFLRYRRLKARWEQRQLLIVIFLLATMLHVTFAAVGWFYRYEAYLVALGLLINGTLLFEVGPGGLFPKRDGRRHTGFAAASLLVLFVASAVWLSYRGGNALMETPRATTNIYEQQYQMAAFLRDYYAGATVAANDIGAINYFADIRCLDLWGLGSTEVARARMEKRFDTAKILELGRMHRVRIALVYSGWFEEFGGVPAEWTKVGQWRTLDCLVCGNDTVSFYAVEPTETLALKRNLRAFSTRLPPRVAQAGDYLGP